MAELVCKNLGHDMADDHFGVVHVMHREDAASLQPQRGWRNTQSVFDYRSSGNISQTTFGRWQNARRTETCGESG